jgi:D-glycero-alpha-D-manno-heptose-7-phosphate kinase
MVEVAQEHGAIGWKGNDAKGDGGSLTLLCDHRYEAKRAMIREIEAENRLIPSYLSRYGLRVWKYEIKKLSNW